MTRGSACKAWGGTAGPCRAGVCLELGTLTLTWLSWCPRPGSWPHLGDKFLKFFFQKVVHLETPCYQRSLVIAHQQETAPLSPFQNLGSFPNFFLNGSKIYQLVSLCCPFIPAHSHTLTNTILHLKSSSGFLIPRYIPQRIVRKKLGTMKIICP